MIYEIFLILFGIILGVTGTYIYATIRYMPLPPGQEVLCIGFVNGEMYVLKVAIDPQKTDTADLLRYVKAKHRAEDNVTLNIIVGYDLNYSWIQDSEKRV